ncbi:hypothetical protein [Streptomyces gilvosporeus]|uniref:DAGKc domain-containing protein n=1 Tax=Streptomyces gilvosporeus TaxID=553510 RepID=A0A1V0TTF9_9ACTN|nr:hypothetical protein [Streptomyces gilvosporeus]ARF56181.1 hypothetical protein B1H19_20135 [Streptomyces gilvosporeus]
MVIDPVARRTDGESVRIARDVLCAGAAGAGAKICLPEGPEEFARALARRGQRRPVVIGDDRALLRAVGLLHKERELARVPVSVVPVGAPAALALSRLLGVPTDTVAAARTVLDGGERAMDLLTDDSDGIVLGGLRIPCADGAPVAGLAPLVERAGPVADHRSWWEPAARTARTALALLAPGAGRSLGLGPGGRHGRAPEHRLRIEADGVLLADLDRPVRGVSVTTGPDPEEDRGAAGADGGRRGAGGGFGRDGGGEGRREGDGWDAGAGHDGGGGRDGGSRHDGGARPDARGGPDGRGGGGLAEIEVRWPDGARPVRAQARAVTVSGADFHYRADAVVGGPVRTRTWTVQAGAWRLTVPR